MRLPVKTAAGEYTVWLQRGGLARAAELCRLDRRVLIVTDDGVPAEYAETVAAQCAHPRIVTLPQGEPTKCMESLCRLLREMVEAEFTRTDCVVAVGGGVVGDLAGFAAACFMRGIDFYNMPTTVLSQVDSSIGGKVAVDFEGYKNLVGAFYPPRAVVIDSDTLATLPARQMANGLAESVKMALTSDAELFALFEREDPAAQIDRVIEASLRIKRAVVEQDEREGGLRRILNFGHTLAHAIESETGLNRLYHGECVALGMLPMCSEEVRGRLLPVLEKLGLPTRIACDPERLIAAMRHDKKMTGEEIAVVTVPEVGRCEIQTLPFEEFARRIREVLS